MAPLILNLTRVLTSISHEIYRIQVTTNLFFELSSGLGVSLQIVRKSWSYDINSVQNTLNFCLLTVWHF